MESRNGLYFSMFPFFMLKLKLYHFTLDFIFTLPLIKSSIIFSFSFVCVIKSISYSYYYNYSKPIYFNHFFFLYIDTSASDQSALLDLSLDIITSSGIKVQIHW